MVIFDIGIMNFCMHLDLHLIILVRTDLNDNQHPGYGQKDHLVCEEINSCSCESAPLRITCSVSNRHGCVEGSNDSYRSSVLAHLDEVSPTFMTPSFF
jgi:hypothetical protein